MSSLAIACVMFVCLLVSTWAAMGVARRLPEHHLNKESKDVITLGLGVIGTLTALVLGLLVDATKGTYDAQSGTVKELAAEVAVLDRVLNRYGPEAGEARGRLRALADALLEQVWPQEITTTIDFSGGPTRQTGEAFFDAVAALEPKTDSQRLLKSRAQKMAVEMGQLRQRLVVNSERSIPTPLLVVLGVWQAVLFAGLGLLATRNATTIAVLVVCMLSMSSALFLVLELDRPFDGTIRVSDTSLRAVISHLGE
ncbi:DUF4239 domain-containing protein [Nitrosomonas sp. Nm34]|uniref:bestrophin-like domain n=1 Tax=Nitrosomonas sp. Nm34 TaxID=1881055 RepID=UPI0008F2DD41|nr:DUF4239 domain-containing protein [Nitrosomonas sp. Nm34]SFI85946.1 Protein of unknown function [Nitrosomonas sp. Nm34]